MPTPDFMLTFDACASDTFAEFATRLRAMPKRRAADVTIGDLCADSAHPNGLYFFFNADDRLLYVGKATSRSFIERIPSHFDTREDAWFATLPRKLRTAGAMAVHADAHAAALQLRLVLLGVQSKQTAFALESVLRSYLQPALNAARAGRVANSDLLQEFRR